MFVRMYTFIRESFRSVRVTLRVLQGASQGWMDDLIDRSSERMSRPNGRTHPNEAMSDEKLMAIAKRGVSRFMTKQAVSFIKHEANLLALATDGSADRYVRVLAVSRLTSTDTLLAIAFGREIDLALAAVDVIHDQKALALILRRSPFVSLRRVAADRCDDDEALLQAEARDPDEDVRWIAGMRFAHLNSGVCMIQA